MKVRQRGCGVAGLAVILIATVQVSAQTPAPAAGPHLAAIGQITYGSNSPGAAICTGTLVAPDLVLTAGHCLREGPDRQAMDPATVHFAAGRKGASAVATRTGAQVILSGVTGLTGDIALLLLDTPIPASIVAPVQVTTDAAAPLTMIAYRRDAPDQAVRDDRCDLVATGPGLLGLGCAVVSGNSGAPVLVWQDGNWHLVAVMVAASRTPGPVRSFAVMPDAALLARIATR